MKDVSFDEYSLERCLAYPQNVLDLKKLGAKNNFWTKTIFGLNNFFDFKNIFDFKNNFDSKNIFDSKSISDPIVFWA